jgi:hypothetical protein
MYQLTAHHAHANTDGNLNDKYEVEAIFQDDVGDLMVSRQGH